MRKLLLVSTILIYVTFLTSAQQDTLTKPKTYKTWIKLVDGSEIKLKWGGEIKGILYQINDSSLSISKLLKFTDHTRGFAEPINIDYTSTEVIKIRSGKKIWKGIAIGATTGFILGGLVGYLGQAKITSPKEVAIQTLGLGAFVGTCGALIGGLAGSIKIRIPINGSIDNFNDNKSRLKKYSYVH
jgi:hypothetical protein